MIKKHTGDIRSFLNPATLEAASSPIGNAYEVTMIDAHKIYVNEKNIYGIRGIEEMANSMAISDSIPPLVVTPIENGRYKLISGERRLSAVLLREERGEIENPKVPCFVREIEAIGPLSKDQSELFLLITENAHRDKTPLEKLNEVKAMEPIARTIYDNEHAKGNVKGKFRTFFAENILNMTESALTRLKALENLIPVAKDALEDGRISQSLAVELSKKTDEEQARYMELLARGANPKELQEFQPQEQSAPKKNEKKKEDGKKVTAADISQKPSPLQEKQADEPQEQLGAPINNMGDDDAEDKPEQKSKEEPPKDVEWLNIREDDKTTIVAKIITAKKDGEYITKVEYGRYGENCPVVSIGAYPNMNSARAAAIEYMERNAPIYIVKGLLGAGYIEKMPERFGEEDNPEPVSQDDQPSSGEDVAEKCEEDSNDEDFAWELVESNIADELRELVATFQHNARGAHDVGIEASNNRIAAVFDILLLDYLELAVAAAKSREKAAKEGEI